MGEGYFYAIWRNDGCEVKRIDTSTRIDQAESLLYQYARTTYPNDFLYIVASRLDNEMDQTTLLGPDSIAIFREGLERAHQWKPDPRATPTITKLYDFEGYDDWDQSQLRKWNSEQMNKPSDVKAQTPVDGNLKTLAAINKPKVSDVPPIAFFALGAAMSDGAAKYDRYNWRETRATSSVFVDAMARHLLGWYSGEDHAKDSKVHHLAHLMASCAILLDAELHGKLNDDRPEVSGEVIEAMMKLIKKD